MTPGLAGFVVAEAEPHWNDALDSVMAALAETFALAPARAGAPGGGRRRTWLDTFDWRLYRAGLLLEYVTANRAGQLVLTSVGASAAGDPEPVVQPVTGWRVVQPGLFDSYGFRDSFNPSFTYTGLKLEGGSVDSRHGWVDGDYLGIDQGPILLQAANARDDFVWRYMRRVPAIRRGLLRAGFTGGWLSESGERG